MSWFSSAVAIDAQVERATDESIPFGEVDLSLSLEITDLIRSKQVAAKEAMRSLKRRLTATKNPNTQLATLHLIDTCVKNGGAHFIVEIASREFIDTIVSLIHDDKTNESVRDLALDLIQAWAIAFKDNFQLKYIHTTYRHLKDDGYSFPEVGTGISSTLFDSSAPPEWEDSDACMICSNSFSMINRKHHCRNCGGVYCQTHSSKNIPLPELGITEPVRVCDTCYDEIHHKNKSSKSKKHRRSKHQKDVSRARARYDSDDDEDLKRALELSLQESQGMTLPPAPVTKPPQVAAPMEEDEEDDEMKAAIAASLREFEQEQQRHQPPQAQQPQQPQESGPYANLLPQASYTPQTYTQQLAHPPQQQQYQGPQQPQQPLIPPQLSNFVTSQEENDVVQFASKVQDLKRNPGYAIENPELNDLYRRAIPLTPKISSDMNQSFSKYDQLLDMNTKIDQVMRIYNGLLDRRIERETQQRQQQYAQPSYAPAYGYPPPQAQQYQPHHQQHAQTQHVPSQPVYQQAPQMAPPAQQQMSPYPTQPYPVAPDLTGQSSISASSNAPVPQLPQLQQTNYHPPEDPFKDPPMLKDDEEDKEDEEQEEEEEFTAPPSTQPSLPAAPEPVQATNGYQPSSPMAQHTSPVQQHTSPLQAQTTPSYSPQAYQYTNGYAPQPQPQAQQQYAQVPQVPPYPQQTKITDINFPTVPMSKPPVLQHDVTQMEAVVKEEPQLIDL